jgi:hypothetical protein
MSNVGSFFEEFSAAKPMCFFGLTLPFAQQCEKVLVASAQKVVAGRLPPAAPNLNYSKLFLHLLPLCCFLLFLIPASSTRRRVQAAQKFSPAAAADSSLQQPRRPQTIALDFPLFPMSSNCLHSVASSSKFPGVKMGLKHWPSSLPPITFSPMCQPAVLKQFNCSFQCPCITKS